MGGGSSKPSTQYVKTETSNLPEYAKPYYESMMQNAQGMTLGSTYQPYGGQRIADFTPAQQWAMNNQMQATGPQEYNTASGLATAAGLGAIGAGQYTPGQFNVQNVQAPQAQTYQTSYGSQPLTQYQMNAPQNFGQEQANQYMSPYAQSVMDVQKNQAIRDAKQGQLAQNLGAARQGTYGGARQLLATTERERNLGQQLGDIQAKGQQAAYENAQQQFERDRQAGLNVGQQNLQALLQTQGLQTNTGLQAALANLQSANTAQDLGQKNYMQAALANQQYGLEGQRLGEQSRQFGASNALAGYGQAGQMAQTLANIGQGRFQSDQALRDKQLQTATLDQALQQQGLDQQYQDYLRQQGYPLEMLQQYSSLLRGVPVTPSTQTTSTQPTPSLANQILGVGLGGLGAYKALSSGA